MNTNKILDNIKNLNTTLDNVLETFDNIDLPDYNKRYGKDNYDRFFEATTRYENKVLDSKIIKSINNKTNDFVSFLGSCGIIFTIPVVTFGVLTGGLSNLLLAPILIGGCLGLKVYANRKRSIIKTLSSVSKKQLTKLKNKAKHYCRTKSLEKQVDKLSLNQPLKENKKVSAQTTNTRQASFLVNRIRNNIELINDRASNIAKKVQTVPNYPKDKMVAQLQNDAINTIIKIRIDMETLSKINQNEKTLTPQINSSIIQCKNAVDSIAKEFQITTEMLNDRISEIRSFQERQQQAPTQANVQQENDQTK